MVRFVLRGGYQQEMSEEENYRQLENYVQRERDTRRPDMETVVRVFDEIFGRFRDAQPIVPVLRGPDTWSWLDTSGASLGFEKWYVVSRSAMAGAEGYPMVTVRQSIAPRLDSWLTFSQLIIGPDERAIEGSLATAIENHMGGFDGIRASVAEMITRTGGIPTPAGSITTEKKEGLN